MMMNRNETSRGRFSVWRLEPHNVSPARIICAALRSCPSRGYHRARLVWVRHARGSPLDWSEDACRWQSTLLPLGNESHCNLTGGFSLEYFSLILVLSWILIGYVLSAYTQNVSQRGKTVKWVRDVFFQIWDCCKLGQARYLWLLCNKSILCMETQRMQLWVDSAYSDCQKRILAWADLPDSFPTEQSRRNSLP